MGLRVKPEGDDWWEGDSDAPPQMPLHCHARTSSEHPSIGRCPAENAARLVPLTLNHTTRRAKIWIAVKVITTSSSWFFTA
jgi:hypothetical protein